MGIRGSMHYNYNQQDSFDYADVNVHRMLARGSKANLIGNTYLEEVNDKAYIGTINSGMMLQNEKTQNGVSFTVPYMSRCKFLQTDSRLLGAGVGNTPDQSDNNYIVQYRTSTRGLDAEHAISTRVYAGAGTDFQLLNFVGVPPIRKYDVTATGISYGTI
jgi:hypothetical protein